MSMLHVLANILNYNVFFFNLKFRSMSKLWVDLDVFSYSYIEMTQYGTWKLDDHLREIINFATPLREIICQK